MEKEYYAHISDSKPNEKLINHLRLTAELAAANGSSFHHEKVCKQLGLLHDIGKRTENFQKVLSGSLHKQDHAIIAGIFYKNHGSCNNTWLKEHMALIMACHHSYLYSDSLCFCKTAFEETYLESQIPGVVYQTYDNHKSVVATKEEYAAIRDYVDQNEFLLDLSDSDFFDVTAMTLNEKMFYIRMLFSCLVDADYSATIEYQNPGYIDNYFYENGLDVVTYQKKLDAYYKRFPVCEDTESMNYIRSCVFETCRQSGDKSGFLTLTAPTGSGKTLALMQFALANAAKYSKKRIFIVLPYLSIINQNAAVYSEIFGSDVVFVDDSQTEYTEQTAVYSERWSSPIIVTTSVRFFETLFANKAPDVRRLHNIADSVIVFDECQTLPSKVINSTIEVLQSLTKYYGCTVLFSTATQPSYQCRNHEEIISVGEFRKRSVRVSDMTWRAEELIPDVDSLFTKYQQIHKLDVQCRNTDTDCEYLMNYFAEEWAALYVFNTVKHAIEMYDLLILHYDAKDCYLITSNLCSADKLSLIHEIRERLDKQEHIRVVATQCIEAGVDLDFPAGAREYGPLESIIQTAGRINRNCRYDGKFLVFLPESHTQYDYPSVSYKHASDVSRRKSDVLDSNRLSLYDMDFVDEYYHELYCSVNYRVDSDKLYQAESAENYRSVSDAYKLIENKNQIIMIVPPVCSDRSCYDELVSGILEKDYIITKGLMKKLSSYTVSLYVLNHFDPAAVGRRLSFPGGYQTNWYLLEQEDAYSKIGFDKSVSERGGIFL